MLTETLYFEMYMSYVCAWAVNVRMCAKAHPGKPDDYQNLICWFKISLHTSSFKYSNKGHIIESKIERRHITYVVQVDFI